jgi:hypothetical protein
MSIDSIGRDESLVSFLFRIVIRILLNIFIAIIGYGINFLWNVYFIIKSFQPSLWEGFIFFLGCISVIISIVVSFLLSVYIVGASAIITINKTIGPNQRIDYQQRRNMNMNSQPSQYIQ